MFESHVKHLFENVVPKLPEEPNATKFKNFLKVFKSFKSIGAMGGSAYDSHQTLQAKLSKEDARALAKAMIDQGWKVPQWTNQSDDWEVRESPKGLKISVDFDIGLVSITGTKEAKRSTLPYYD